MREHEPGTDGEDLRLYQHAMVRGCTSRTLEGLAGEVVRTIDRIFSNGTEILRSCLRVVRNGKSHSKHDHGRTNLAAPLKYYQTKSLNVFLDQVET